MLLDDAPRTPPPAGASVRFTGRCATDLLRAQSSGGRRRRWVYSAVGDDEIVVGAAAVDVGVLGLGTAFAFATGPWGSALWDAGPGRAGRVDGLPGTAAVRRRGATLRLAPSTLEIDVPSDGGRLRADVTYAADAPVSLLTPTPAGGWNATVKSAGHPGTGWVEVAGHRHAVAGLGWSDATDGRQDRRTTWRWAAGGGRGVDGRRVGLQASTGMNGLTVGEDLVWWDDRAVPLEVEALAPVDDGAVDGAWRLAGADWELVLRPSGVRAADEGLGPIRSRYSQPIGWWEGTLPAPDGTPRPVRLAGVAEDHEAHW